MLTLMRSLRVNCAFDCALVRVTALVPVAILAMAEIHKKSKVLKINVSVGFPLNFIKFKEEEFLLLLLIILARSKTHVCFTTLLQQIKTVGIIYNNERPDSFGRLLVFRAQSVKKAEVIIEKTFLKFVVGG